MTAASTRIAKGAESASLVITTKAGNIPAKNGIDATRPKPINRPTGATSGSGASDWASTDVRLCSVVETPRTGTTPDDVIPTPPITALAISTPVPPE
ncbi:hypothetical protein [Nocardia puris]|uniref:hypothetical protein n=1 Tax=Nocardia puris TaxID=208602 RepID=UPI002E2229CD